MNKEECKCPLCTGTEMEDNKTYKCTSGDTDCYIGKGDSISPEQIKDFYESL